MREMSTFCFSNWSDKEISMKSSVFLVIALTVASMNSGCTTVGRKFNAENVSKIQEGVTTKTEVIRLLGEPYSKRSYGGQANFTYMCMEGRLSPWLFVPVVNLFFLSSAGNDNGTQQVSVMFDQRDVVSQVNASSSGKAADIKMNASSRSNPETSPYALVAPPAQVIKIPDFTKGKTTRDEIVTALGVPQDIKLDAGKQILTYKFPGDNPFDPNSGKSAIFILNDKAVLEDMIK